MSFDSQTHFETHYDFETSLDFLQLIRQKSPSGSEQMVGAVRFELTTSCTRNKRATRLRYAPNQTRSGKCGNAGRVTMDFS
jgi:hypothetical protein